MVIFIADGHTYWTKADPKRRLYSPSSLFKPFQEPFDEEYWSFREVLNRHFTKEVVKAEIRESGLGYRPSKRVLLNHFEESLVMNGLISPQQLDREIEEVLMDWQWKNVIANFKGTDFHLRMENKKIEDGLIYHPLNGAEHIVHRPPKFTFDNEAPDDLSTLPDGVHPELLVYIMDLMICGQIDYPVLYTLDGARWGDVLDYKTNDKDPREEKEVKFSKFYGPLSHIHDNMFNEYSLKMSAYAYMLEHHGYNIGDLALGWAPDYDEENITWIEVPYLRQEIEDVIAERITK